MNTNFYFNITLEFGLFSIGLGIITLCYTIGKGLGLAGANARANYVYGAMVGLYAAYFITILWLLNSFYRANIMIPGHVYLRLFVAIAFLALYVANQNYLRTHVSVMALHVFLLCLF